jgi:putative transposase
MPSILGPCFRTLFRLLASLARLAVRTVRSKDLEMIVLRHQLTVLRRQNSRNLLTEHDRSLLGAIAAALPRPQRAGWLVTPDTLLRWRRRRRPALDPVPTLPGIGRL